MAPFWRGEKVGRSYDLGLAMGRFLRELRERYESGLPAALAYQE